jgi:DNA-binding response OmpR family regulator
MRGTVVLLAGQDWSAVYAEHFRGHGLMVYELQRPEDALRKVDTIVPDVIVAVCSGGDDPTAIRELRGRVDWATSIIAIVIASRETNDENASQLLRAGADSILLMPAPPDEVLYEIQRALILRRSGRRLPRSR